MLQVRVVEVLAAISLTTDIAGGMAFEKGLRTTLVANEFGGRLALTPLGVARLSSPDRFFRAAVGRISGLTCIFVVPCMFALWALDRVA